MAVRLTSHDVARLVSDPSPAVRAELTDKIAADLTGDSLRPEETVRASLSLGLRHSRNLPRDVALKLADDIETIALPILADSLVLTEDDLVRIVRRGEARKQEAVALRPNLTEAVADAIITYAEEPAVVALMDNRTATIAEASFHRAVDRFAHSERLKQATVQRAVLPMTIAERLVTMVSTKLQEHLMQRHPLPPTMASDIVLASREQAVMHLSRGASDEELGRMITQMHRHDRITPSLMLRALCTGDIAFFEAAMAIKSDIPVGNAQLLIHDPSRRGLAALYRRAAMPDALFGAIQSAIDVVDETGFDGNARDLERFRSRVISRVLTMVELLDASDADYLLDKLGDVLVHAPA